MKQVEETEAVRKAEEAYKETLERETIASQEKEQKIIEHIIERKKIVEKAKGRLMDAEAREYERHMKRLEKKMPNWRPKKGTMHLMGMRASEVSLEAVAAKELSDEDSCNSGNEAASPGCETSICSKVEAQTP